MKTIPWECRTGLPRSTEWPMIGKTRIMEHLSKIKTFKMRGKLYHLKIQKLRAARGMCEHPNTKGKTVYIDSRETGKHLLATILDELFHTAMWEVENTIVDTISDDMADFLWRAGYRNMDEDEYKVAQAKKRNEE